MHIQNVYHWYQLYNIICYLFDENTFLISSFFKISNNIYIHGARTTTHNTFGFMSTSKEFKFIQVSNSTSA